MHDQEVNSNQIIEEGKSVEEAIEKGLERLGVSRDQAEVEVIEEGTKGVLSLIGAKQAKVVVRKKAKDDVNEERDKIDETVTNLMKFMGISSQLRMEIEDGIHKVEIETAGVDGLLIGKKGQTLDDLGHLIRRMVGKQLRRSVRMDVDVGGYRGRRAATLRRKAISAATRVKATGKEIQMEPLSAAERRIIHLAVADDAQVKTYTVGNGDLKSVIVAPTRQGRRNSESRET